MKSIKESAQKAGVGGIISIRVLASKVGLSPPISLTTLIDKLESPPQPPPPSVKPAIYVSSKGDGSFVVEGSHFLPNATVHIRVVDDALTNVWLTTPSTQQGTFSFPTGKLCKLPGNLHFSANDGRPDKNDLTGTLWSNTITVSC